MNSAPSGDHSDQVQAIDYLMHTEEDLDNEPWGL